MLENHPNPARTRMPFGRRLALAGLLIGMTLIWGWTFSLMKEPVETYGVVPFLAVRFTIAALVLTLINFNKMSRRTLLVGMGIGVTLGLAYLTQTYGLKHSTATNTGLITGLFVLFGPLSNRLLFKVRTSSTLWMAIGVSTLGLILLTGSGIEGLMWGDPITLICALMYGLQIALLDRYAKSHNTAVLTQGQIVAAALMFLVIWPFADTVKLPPSSQVWFALIITSLFATAMGFFIQTFVQQRLSAVEVSVILLFEPVFATIFGYLIHDDRLIWLQWVGAVLMFGAVVMVELYPVLRRNGKNAKAGG